MFSTVLRSVSRTCLRSFSSNIASSPHTPNPQVSEDPSPFHFGKSKHILGYTGLIIDHIPRPLPETYQECLTAVKAGFEDRSLGSLEMLKLLHACNNIDEVEEYLDLVKKYNLTIFPQIFGIPNALLRTLIRLDSPEIALNVFQKRSEFALFPSSLPISILMDILLKREKFELALDAYDLLEQVYSPVINQATAVGAFAHICEGSTALMLEARELLDTLKLEEWEFTHEAVKIAVVLLKRQNRVSEANRLIKEFDRDLL